MGTLLRKVQNTTTLQRMTTAWPSGDRAMANLTGKKPPSGSASLYVFTLNPGNRSVKTDGLLIRILDAPFRRSHTFRQITAAHVSFTDHPSSRMGIARGFPFASACVLLCTLSWFVRRIRIW